MHHLHITVALRGSSATRDQLLVMAPPVRLLPQEERWSTTGQVLQKGQPFHYWTWTRCCRNVLPDSMVFAAWEETLWVYTHYLSSLFCFYRSDILSINRRAEPAHVYPTAAKLTIKSLIMSIEFILITTIWVSYQNEAILNNRQRSVTLVATAKTRLTVRRFVGSELLMCFRSAHVLPTPWQFTQHSYT